jgi:hypothetical protein
MSLRQFWTVVTPGIIALSLTVNLTFRVMGAS